MLLQQLKLNNIRSYVEETINFPEGATLLSGDIGTGKSSLLLALEFALFGTSRPDLPGEALLKKGSTQGSVELTFHLEGKEIIIKRNLKKEKCGIKQTAGHLMVNKVKKELTAIEMKAEIISLLGYPEELVSKNKNYIFRYTVYTPQEEMKLILQEKAEIRQDVLRKIFQVDKYKSIRENLQIYLKQLRTDIAILNTQLEPFEEENKYLQEIVEEKILVQKSLQELEIKLIGLQERLEIEKEKLTEKEEKQKKFLELEQQQKKSILLLDEKKKQQQETGERKEELQEQFKELSFPAETEKEKNVVKNELELLEQKRNQELKQKIKLEEQVRQIQEKIVVLQGEIKVLSEEDSQTKDKKELFDQLKKDVSEQETKEQEKKQLEELEKKTVALMIKNQTILQEEEKTQKKIESLETCPTCLQEVSLKHKERITTEKIKKIEQAENLLFELKKKQAQILEQKRVIERVLLEILQKKNLLTRTEIELAQLTEKRELLKNKKEQLVEIVQENNQLMQQMGETQKNYILEKLDREIEQKRQLLEQFTKKEHLQEQMELILKQEKKIEEEIAAITKNLLEIDKELFQQEDFSLKIVEQQKQLNKFQEQEKIEAIKQAQLSTKIEHLLKEEKQRTEKILQLKEKKKKLVETKETYHWLEEYLLKLTYTIEKQVMLNIHQLFNQLFQEWFSIIIDDENIRARIDDEFSPIIELDGYEINFINLSGGEKTSVALAYRLALNRVINDVVHEIKTKEILILDEPTDGFSSEQLDKVRDVLERLQLRQTIIVSHESKMESFVDQVLRIEKEGQESKVC